MAARPVARLSLCAHAVRPASCEQTASLTLTLRLAAASASRPQPAPTPSPTLLPPQQRAYASSSSSSSTARWKTRQTSDPYTKSSKLSALKSRAAYKLLEINDKHKLLRPGASVVDLGFAPGSWSQVAKNRVGEQGRVVGIDVIPAQPPRGVSALQGDFLSEGVQERVREFVREWKGRGRGVEVVEEEGEGEEGDGEVRSVVDRARESAEAHGEEKEVDVAVEEVDGVGEKQAEQEKSSKKKKKLSAGALDLQQGRVIDVVLSDMCAPFPGLEIATWINSVNRPYRRMMNTSGNPFRDHAGSIVS